MVMVAKGFPQGGVLSPILWSMVVNDLQMIKIRQHRFEFEGYAIFIVILIIGKLEQNHIETPAHCTERSSELV